MDLKLIITLMSQHLGLPVCSVCQGTSVTVGEKDQSTKWNKDHPFGHVEWSPPKIVRFGHVHHKYPKDTGD